jgi:hypothetical protein
VGELVASISDTRDKAAALLGVLLAPPRDSEHAAAEQRAHDADERRHRRGGHAPSRSSSGRWARDEDWLYWWPLSCGP